MMNINFYNYYTQQNITGRLSPSPDSPNQKPFSPAESAPIVIPKPIPRRGGPEYLWTRYVTESPRKPKLTPILEKERFSYKLNNLMPISKIEGMITIVSRVSNLFDDDNLFENKDNLFENKWIHSFIDIEGQQPFMTNFDQLYVEFLKKLMIEDIQTPLQLYEMLFNYAKVELESSESLQKMLFLFRLLELGGEKNFEGTGDISALLNPENRIENFVLALQTFIKYDNNPCKTLEQALNSDNHEYRLFLATFIGASYGSNWMDEKDKLSSQEIQKILNQFTSRKG